MNIEGLRGLFPIVFAFFLAAGCGWFLWSALLDPNTAAIPENHLSEVIGGVFTLLGATATFVFNTAVANSTARHSEQARRRKGEEE